jgi:DNA-binding response OmpR family regulator
MDDPPSEGNERVAEIFIVSTDETVTVPLKEHLEQNGHQVTVLTGEAQLHDILPARKPGLLICDGTTGEGYEFIRWIKADEHHWVIPVLVLTTASTMDALLQVLASNADNFIAPPYNSPDHLSVIENMIATPVERPVPGDMNKQFRVREGDQTYVVTVTGRQLLEYLLSTFEIVAGKSSELSAATSKLQNLSEFARGLEQTLTGQTREIEVLKTTVQQNEQKSIALARECEELKKVLSQKTEEIRNFTEESDNKKTTLDTMENALMEEETRNVSLEKVVRDLQSEISLQKNVLAEEKTRILSAEEKINTLKQAKEQSEHDLDQVISGKIRDIEALNAIIQAKEQKNTVLAMECEEQKKTIEQKTEDIRYLTEESDSKKISLENAQKALAEREAHTASLEKTLRDLTSELEQQKSALVSEKNLSLLAEQGINALGQEKTQSECEMSQIIIGLNETVQQHVTEISRLKGELESETGRRVMAENQAGELQRKFEQTTTTHHSEIEGLKRQAANLQEVLTTSNAALETERELRRTSEEKTKTVVRQQEDLEKQSLIANEEMKRAKIDQDAIISQIKEELKTASNHVQFLEADVSNLAREKSQAGLDIQSLTAELEHARITIANERKSHLVIEEGHADAAKERHLVQQSLFSPDEENSQEENLDLVIQEEPHLPVSVPQVSRSVAGKNTLGLQQTPGPKKSPVSAGSTGDIPRIFSGVIPRVSGISDADSLFLEYEPIVKNADPAPGTIKVNRPAEEQKDPKYSPEKTSHEGDEGVLLASYADAKRETERPGSSGKEVGSRKQPGETSIESVGLVPGGEISLTRSQWLDLLKWARHSESLPEDERLKIVRMGRLVRKDGKLGKKQQEQVREILSSAYALGYHSR